MDKNKKSSKQDILERSITTPHGKKCYGYDNHILSLPYYIATSINMVVQTKL